MPEASAWPAIMQGTKMSAKAPRAMTGLMRRKRADLRDLSGPFLFGDHRRTPLANVDRLSSAEGGAGT